jgi:hypothetical protein
MFILVTTISLWLKTEHGIGTVTRFVSDYIEKTTDHKYQIKLKNIKAYFPLILEVGEIVLNEKEEQVIVLKGFCINILPSLFWLWEVTIWDLSADQIILTKIPNLDSNNSSDLSLQDISFIPKINIRNIAINEIILGPTITGLAEDMSIEARGNLLFNPRVGSMNFVAKLKSNIVDETLSFLDNAALEAEGGINIINGNIKLENFKLSSNEAEIDGYLDVNYIDNFLQGHANYTSLWEGENSKLEGTIDFSGTPSLAHVSTNGSGYLIPNEKSYFQAPSSTWSSDIIIEQGNVRGELKIASGPLKANGEFGYNDHKIYLKNFNIRGNNLISGANLIFDPATKIITGDVHASSANISELKSFFPFLGKGSMDIKTTYKQDMQGRQQVTVKSKIKHLATDFGNCDLADIDMTIQDLWKLKIDNADIKVRSLFINNNSIKDFSLKAKNEGDFVSFISSVKSLEPYPLNLNIDGKLISQHGQDNLQIINNIKGTFGKLQINNQQPITITIGSGFSVLAPEVKVNNGKINLDLHVLDDKQIKVRLLMTNFQAQVVPDFLPEVFNKSLISGALTIGGSVQLPIFDSELAISGIELVKKDSNFATLKLLANYHNSQLSINSEIIHLQESLASFNGKFPYKLSLLPFASQVIESSPVSAQLLINKETNLLALLPMPPGHKLFGNLNGHLELRGSIESPIINGVIGVDNTEYKYKTYGIKLKDISAKIVAHDKAVAVTKFIAKDNYGNIVEGAGKLSIQKDFPFSCNLSTDKLNFINTPYLQGEIQGKMLISGNSQKALAKGDFALGPMEIKIPEHFSDNIPTLNITETLNSNKIIYETLSKAYVWELDLNLAAKNQVYVRGWGVNTLLTGDLKVTNEVANPNIFGKLKSVRGRYQEFGKSLTVRDGVLSFDGPLDPSPFLNIVGFTVVDGVEIRLILAGSIFKPDIKIESTPYLTQENALSLLLFGKNPDKISEVQALSLADGVRRISGHGGGFDPLGLGRKILGVDDINFEDNEDTATKSVRVGKYLTDKVYLEVEQGDQVSGTKTRIEVEITPKISIEANTGNRG